MKKKDFMNGFLSWKRSHKTVINQWGDLSGPLTKDKNNEGKKQLWHKSPHNLVGRQYESKACANFKTDKSSLLRFYQLFWKCLIEILQGTDNKSTSPFNDTYALERGAA